MLCIRVSCIIQALLSPFSDKVKTYTICSRHADGLLTLLSSARGVAYTLAVATCGTNTKLVQLQLGPQANSIQGAQVLEQSEHLRSWWTLYLSDECRIGIGQFYDRSVLVVTTATAKVFFWPLTYF
jgi:hypothetical protein